ncbi:hypothetical protein Daus18300_001429 [Diaporthe australafricana]|uniref:Protein kinase domain-containing protein n=1 Tax=Diaporthe australafricana TaxID=127596 RepID=A0ABR3XVN7_9PEZI
MHRYEEIGAEDIQCRSGLMIDAVLHKAVDLSTGRTWAVKTLTPMREADRKKPWKNDVLRYIQELERLKHKHIALFFHSYGYGGGGPLNVVFELYQKGNMHKLINARRAHGVRDLRLVRAFIEQILPALMFLHGEGFVPAEMSSLSILCDGEPGEVNLVVERMTAIGTLQLFSEDELKLTRVYYSPETHSRGHMDKKSNMFSVGLILTEILGYFDPQ